jgi:hypothetical protein
MRIMRAPFVDGEDRSWMARTVRGWRGPFVDGEDRSW